MPGELAGPQSRAQARARRHVARMVVTFVIGKNILDVFIAIFHPKISIRKTYKYINILWINKWNILFFFSIVFIICFLPHHVFMLWFHLHPRSLYDYDEYWHILRIIGFCLRLVQICRYDFIIQQRTLGILIVPYCTFWLWFNLWIVQLSI